ncbi:MAG TPA: D-isomer specific 2-hydroxyacid dehydrogenase family protein [Actinomycetota bacterium]|nr:D-isomer specific 2-hydroxyacid dehydrogenase family protein [Actinomycetota bacterium]
MPVRIAISPASYDALDAAVVDAGGVLADPESADGIVWTNPRDPEALRSLLELSRARWVQLPFAGIEDFVAAGVIDPQRTWTCTKGVYGPACAEHALCLMLAAARRLHEHLRAGEWRTPGLGSPERLLRGSTVVVVGTGGIGASLIELLEPFGVRVIAVNRSGSAVQGAERTVPAVQIEEVLGEGDFVVLALALTSETERMFDEARLARLRPDAWLVNVARGGLIDTDALVGALRARTIGGAALDVTDPEPLPSDHPLWGLDNVIITPHIANTWDMALPELTAMVQRNVGHFIRDEPLEGLVEPALGY